MQPRAVAGAGWLAVLLLLGGCGGSSPTARSGSSLAPSDPTPLEKCQVALSQESPLVTEWPASEKARLESLASRQVVAVQYSGCEMRIIDGCQLPGGYGWRPTTLATDTVEITDADELYAKLPIGAVGLEGQLERSGRLAVRTTVSGHLEAVQVPATLPNTPACQQVTHIVKGISVGAFRLMSGGAIATGGGVNVGGVGAGARTRSQESVMREAGDPERCGEGSEEAPHAQCASPIQVFLVPTGGGAPTAAAVPGGMSDEERARELGGLQITFPEPEDEEWLLRDGSRVLCELPCTRWVPPASGYHLERQSDRKRVDVSDRFSQAPGSQAVAEYQPERGAPLFAAIAFYGMGVPCAIGGAVLLGLALGGAGEDDDPYGTDRDRTGFLIGTSIWLLAITAGTGAWYFLFSDWERFDAVPANRAEHRSPEGLKILLGPGSVGGVF